MKAAVYEKFRGPIEIVDAPDPTAAAGEVVVEVLAVGLCRSDYHGWHGTDPDIVCPHVGGHEFVGRVVAVGAGVQRIREGDRVVAPFVCGCGSCEPCLLGQQQVCRCQQQPGFTSWGAFATYTTVPYADHNAVLVPAEVSDEAAALVGCRVSTAYRGVIERGRLAADEVLCVHGCGGVGLAAIAFGRALGAQVVAVDVAPDALALAVALGADLTLDASTTDDVGGAVHDLVGGAHVSIDCLGHAATAGNSILSLRALGRHVQIGLLPTATTELPISRVIRDELELLGVHGLSASRFDQVFAMMSDGRLDPAAMITQRLSLADVATALPAMGAFTQPGVSVVTTM
ncbi:MAG TPA: alcohol dehydrogenase catalytic domain-containing protein [Ilumatobacteraceae bacterium]|nr:alcohol dehydrogenase catalytic domain-containing protein [Ilumatobacteraceae bacterium]